VTRIAEDAVRVIKRSSYLKEQHPVTRTPVGSVISKATNVASNQYTSAQIEAIITQLFAELRLQKVFFQLSYAEAVIIMRRGGEESTGGRAGGWGG
jgi:hypothetical protein